jgi:hypothetical protein
MALSANFSITRDEIGAMIGTLLSRGLVLDGRQVELVRISKSTGDTTGSFDLEDVHRPYRIFVIPLTNSSAALLTAQPTLAEVAFTHTDDDTVAVTGLGDWTAAYFIVTGRSRKKFA